MKTYPLKSISIEAAKELQFKVVDIVTKQFNGLEILTNGDLGVVLGLNKPSYTKRIERIFAEVFDAESAVFVRGAGTGAIRWGLMSIADSGSKLLVHKAPLYPTTKVTVESMGLKIVEADFNDLEHLEKIIMQNPDMTAALVQHTRQKTDDKYNFSEVIKTIKMKNSNIKIVTDDNYAALKVSKIGCQCGSDLTTFSCFKILGPEGVGVVIGKKELVDWIISCNYSGGSQVQGHEALEALRGLIYAPVQVAIQSEVNEELVERLNNGEIEQVKSAFVANAQAKVVIVEFYEDIANEMLKETTRLGAASHPIGAESKYEIAPMIYRISGTFRKQDPTFEKRMIRINPMRSGTDTIMRILRLAIQNVTK